MYPRYNQGPFYSVACDNRYGFGYRGEWRSISDLIDITNAQDVAMRNLARMVSEVANKPNPPDLSSFIDDYTELATRYAEARNIAQQAIDNASSAWNPVPKALNPATAEYEQLLDAVNPRWGENTWDEGDGSYDDLFSRIKKLGATTKNFEPTPQPGAIDPLQLANVGVKSIEAPPKAVASAVTEAIKSVAKTTGQQVETLTKGLGQGLGSATGQLSWQTIAIIAGVVGLGIMILPKMFAFTPMGRAAALGSGWRY